MRLPRASGAHLMYCTNVHPGESLADVSAAIAGDVAAVKAAVEAGTNGASRVGEVVSTHVIARPHGNVDLVLPLGRTEQAKNAMKK